MLADRYLQNTMHDYTAAVVTSNPKCPRVISFITFTVDIGDNEPIFIGPRRYHPIKHDMIDHEIMEMRRNGIIRPHFSTHLGFPG